MHACIGFKLLEDIWHFRVFFPQQHDDTNEDGCEEDLSLEEVQNGIILAKELRDLVNLFIMNMYYIVFLAYYLYYQTTICFTQLTIRIKDGKRLRQYISQSNQYIHWVST